MLLDNKVQRVYCITEKYGGILIWQAAKFMQWTNFILCRPCLSHIASELYTNVSN